MSSSSSSSNNPTFSISSNPLFSTLLSFAALILLNFPRLLWRILLSPAVLLTGFLFLSLLRLAATQKSIQRQTTNRDNRSQIAVEIKSDQSAISSAAVSGVADPCAFLGATRRSIQRQTKNRRNRSQIAVETESKQSDSSAAVSEAVIDRSEVAVSCACLNATQRPIQRQTKNRKNRSQIAVAIKSKQWESSAAEAAVTLCATQRSIQRQAVEIESRQSESSATVSGAVSDGSGGGASSAVLKESFVQWNVRAPLEVIREEYENEASNESDEPEPRLDRVGLERYPSLAMYYPETDSDSSSDGVWPESMDDNVFLTWDEDEMIEISLDKKVILGFELELEDNLIEIDISPTRNAGEFPDECS